VKRLLTVLFTAMLLLGACGGGDDDPAVSADNEGGSDTTAAGAQVDTVADGKLTVCSDIPYPPFEFEEDGQLQGVDIDLMKGVAEHLGLEADFRDTDFDGIFAALAANRCDVIASSVSITDERKQNNEFSEPYYEISQSLLVRKDDAAKYKDLPDLKGKVVGVQSETTGQEFAESQASTAGFTIREFTGADELITALRSGQIDGVVQDFPVNAYFAKQGGAQALAVARRFDGAGAGEQYGFVVAKGKTELVRAINDGLKHLRDEGTYDQILKRYVEA
jgi:polar amino acid transport system substrate-binding protein